MSKFLLHHFLEVPIKERQRSFQDLLVSIESGCDKHKTYIMNSLHIVSKFHATLLISFHIALGYNITTKEKVEFGIVTKFSTFEFPTIIYMQSIYLSYLLHYMFFITIISLEPFLSY